VPREDRAADLPDSPQELITIADDLVARGAGELAALDRADAALRRALSLTESRFPVLWRLSRVSFLSTLRLSDLSQVAEVAQEGMQQAREAMKIDAKRVEPHYYLALNMAQVADATSARSLVKPMVAAAKRAAEIDKTYDRAGPLLFLGKVHLTAPAWPISVGNVEQATAYLERAVAISPRPIARLFLGQAYFEDDREREAKAQLEQALREAKPGDIEPRFHKEAEETLKRIGN
jgi:tetratricopeptide (TPR) repeat protein